jgi:hypothetical protein
MGDLPEGREALGVRKEEVERDMQRCACHDEGLMARFEREQKDIDERTKLVGGWIRGGDSGMEDGQWWADVRQKQC